jgi:citrate synthase
MSDRRFLSAAEAADALAVTRATLYAYASRGQVHSEPVPGDPKARRYHRDDIERLRERKELRRDPARAAERGLHWGSPVLPSGITLIQDGSLYYRGHDALKLADAATLESVAELLWDAEASERGRLFDQSSPLTPRQLARVRSDTRDPIAMLQVALPLAAAQDTAGHDLRPAAVRRTGARIMRLFTAMVAGNALRLARPELVDQPPRFALRRSAEALAKAEGRARTGQAGRPSSRVPRFGGSGKPGATTEPIHVSLQRAWAPRNTAVVDVIRTALILCADHELNVSAFTARCVASAGSSPYDTVSAALAALKGHRHGGESSRVAALLAEIGSPTRTRRVVANRLRQGERLPGFGHPLYPAGDPRGATLLRLAERSGHAREWALVRSVRTAAADLLQELPNLDFGLAAIARTYRLPEHAPLVLFALGRTAGWIAHAIEQYATDTLIRPRARYTGPLPDM